MANRIQSGNLRLRATSSGSQPGPQQKAAAARIGSRQEQREAEDTGVMGALARPQRQAMLNAKEKAVWLADASKKVRAGTKHTRERSPSPGASKKAKKGKAAAGKQPIPTRSTTANMVDDMQVDEARSQPLPAKKTKKGSHATRPQPPPTTFDSAELFDDMDDDEPLPQTQCTTDWRNGDGDDDDVLPQTQRTTDWPHGDGDDDDPLPQT
ncbi:hypothetical protein BDW22DRAFT_1433688 [Trametopsis cervina]|nr:hypothetical protein BDW22DRAFT_1433688 [Trametopsis cervina]